MIITDEKLSAFLDAELPEAEMEAIREQLIEDENLASRMAELAMVDELVAISYSTIDARPLPESIKNLLAEDEPKGETKTAQIIAFPLLKKFQQKIQQHAAIAAGVVLVIGFGLSQSLRTNTSDDWQAVASILDTAPSGLEKLASTGVQIKPRLSFTNKAGDYCRQFNMSDKNSASENIACRKDNKWQIAATVALDKVQENGTYQTASGGSLLDATLEQMASGDFLDAQAESAAIEQHWSVKK
jgi:negative regulator of sigma E activity